MRMIKQLIFIFAIIFNLKCSPISLDPISLKHFTELEPLGNGTFGQVVLARENRSGKLFALKKIKNNPGLPRENIIQEFSIHKTFDHPNIVKAYYLIEEEDQIVQVLEYCMIDFYDLVKEFDISNSEWLEYYRELLMGVEYLHSQGYAHRDLKPENLLLGMDGKLKIADFGFLCPNTTRYDGIIVGTKEFAPPEMFQVVPYDPCKVDVWSCAVTYLAMKSSLVPWRIAMFEDRDYDHFIRKGMDRYDIIKTLSKKEKEIVAKSLIHDPKARPTAKELFKYFN